MTESEDAFPTHLCGQIKTRGHEDRKMDQDMSYDEGMLVDEGVLVDEGTIEQP